MQNTKELRAFLVEQMNGVAEGSVNMDSAKSISNLAQQVYNTLNIEIRMAVVKSKLGDTEVVPVDFSE